MTYALPTGEDERHIVASWRSGGDRGFEDVFRRYAGPLRALCARRLGSAVDAEDACQEALIRAYASRDRFDAGAPLWPWLATIAANVCIDVRRKRVPDPVDAVSAGDRAADGVQPHDAVEAGMRVRLVDDAVASLPQHYRVPVYLRDVEGWTYTEIADLGGTTVSAVRSSLLRGRRALRRRLTEMAEQRGLWPLPAVVPGSAVRSWRRLTARLSGMTQASPFAPSMGTLAAGWPAVANAAVAAAALVGGLVGASTATAVPLPDVAPVAQLRAVDDRSPAPTAPSMAGAPGSGGAGGSDAGMAVDVPTPAGDATVTAHTGAELDGRGAQTLDASVWAKVPGDAEADVPVWAKVGCNAGTVGAASCDAVDHVPDSDY